MVAQRGTDIMSNGHHHFTHTGYTLYAILYIS